jgi:septum formation protein
MIRGQAVCDVLRMLRNAKYCAADPGATLRLLGPGSAEHRLRGAAPRPGHESFLPEWTRCLAKGLPIGSARPSPSSPQIEARMLGRPKIVLASGSPRRLSLLNQAGIEPDALRPADVDETPKRGELPRACANRLARAKADAALKSVQLDDELRGSFILAADTVVAVGRRILPKANLVDEASQCLRLLSGRNHRVYTAICLVTPKEAFRQRLIETRVRFKRLSEDDIQTYIGSGEWRGKAGGYAVQGIAGSFVVKMVGSYTNVVGLPLYESVTLLGGEGFPIRFGWLNAS